jgi:hypothetical protein
MVVGIVFTLVYSLPTLIREVRLSNKFDRAGL